MIKHTSEHALRATIYPAQYADPWPGSGTRIASETGNSLKYLLEIPADLVHHGALAASPGKGGGFRLNRSPEQIHLHEVFAPFEPVLSNRRACPFGDAVGNDEHPRPEHDRWKHVRDTCAAFFQGTSIHDVAVGHVRRDFIGPGKATD